MFPIVYKKGSIGGQYESIKLIKNPKNVRSIETDATEEDDAPVHSFYIHDQDLGEENVNNYFQSSTKQLKLYDAQLKEKWTYRGLGIRNCLDIQQAYLYTISDAITGYYEMTDEYEGDEDKQKVTHFSAAGIYVYDISKLFKGVIEKYKLAKSIGGVCCHLENSLFSDRFSFVSNYNTIIVLPFPH